MSSSDLFVYYLGKMASLSKQRDARGCNSLREVQPPRRPENKRSEIYTKTNQSMWANSFYMLNVSLKVQKLQKLS